MTDVFSKRKRSEVMSRICARGNKDTELALAHLLRAHKISGWRRHALVRVASGERRVARKRKRRTSPLPSPQRGEGAARASASSPVTRHLSLAVRPDFVFRQARLAVFVDGCFWHGCPKHATQPKNNRAFWHRKLSANKTRDRLVNQTLRRAGWRVLRIWEHTLQWATKKPQEETRLLNRIQRASEGKS
jgi:DNA mismatch endonuclease (patch repair protein)